MWGVESQWGVIERCDICGLSHWGNICPKITLGFTGCDPRDYNEVCDYRDEKIYLDNLRYAGDYAGVQRAQAAFAMHYEQFVYDFSHRIYFVKLGNIPHLISLISDQIRSLGGNPADFGIVQPRRGYGYECDAGYGCRDWDGGYECRG